MVNEIAAANPTRVIEVDARGSLEGEWDCPRISQVLTNLIGNALEHGSGSNVTVKVEGNDRDVTIAIHNRGVAIPIEQLSGLFNPMKNAEAMAKLGGDERAANLGLGLYIAERIVHAHRGRIEVASSEESGTTFTVRLPRAA